MGMAMSLAHSVFTPLAPLFNWFFAGTARTPARREAPDLSCDVTALRPAALTPLPHRIVPSRPLRVLRVADSGQLQRGNGRIVISGRMADVCAELERLAALEARLH